MSMSSSYISPRLKNIIRSETQDPLLFLRSWDKGNRAKREKLLKEFIEVNTGKTAPEIEVHFGQSASLLLARISAYLSRQYKQPHTATTIYCLKALSVFLAATSGLSFVKQFLDVGGVDLTLDILSLSDSLDDIKLYALVVLLLIAKQGRKFKEYLCARDCVAIVCHLLKTLPPLTTTELGCELLDNLAIANPHHLPVVAATLSPTILAVASPQALPLLTNVLCHTITQGHLENLEVHISSVYLQHGCEGEASLEGSSQQYTTEPSPGTLLSFSAPLYFKK
eukprot:GCRY01003509.1.p1 GENE.GCRY01003509.1~~GCRY01003509.1.p1  ORF type:complete len:281 (+),score=64.23 GCRY01003509.1:171-1013(+)